MFHYFFHQGILSDQILPDGPLSRGFQQTIARDAFLWIESNTDDEQAMIFIVLFKHFPEPLEITSIFYYFLINQMQSAAASDYRNEADTEPHTERYSLMQEEEKRKWLGKIIVRIQRVNYLKI